MLVDADAAHAVVDLRPDAAGVEGRLVELDGELERAVELLVLAGRDHVVPAGDLGLEFGGGHLEMVGQGFERVELPDHLVLEAVAKGLGLLDALAVGEADRIDGLAVFHEAEDGVGAGLAVGKFVAEALAGAHVDHDAHREAGDRVELAHETEALFVGRGPGAELDLVDLDRGAADGEHLEHAFAGGAHVVRGVEALVKRRILLHAEPEVAREAARGHDHALARGVGLKHAGLLLRELVAFADLEADDAAFGVADEFLHLGVEVHVDAVLAAAVGERARDAAAVDSTVCMMRGTLWPPKCCTKFLY